jgi:hypothetical protein
MGLGGASNRRSAGFSGRGSPTQCYMEIEGVGWSSPAAKHGDEIHPPSRSNDDEFWFALAMIFQTGRGVASGGDERGGGGWGAMAELSTPLMGPKAGVGGESTDDH